ncbi:MAG TPA: RIO1 family regulatory kinase/ATPase [Candidatus Dormibacteraeota bacterium]|nr:RIO1 family regulatory kinase/ATPase [Candidatus Dormibacteraeota bacterium]
MQRNLRRPPSWLITSPEAVDTELGLIKTGKEADTHLVERRLGERGHLLARKVYRSLEHRTFHNDAAYRAGRRTGERRVDLAMAQGSRAGMRMRAVQWARHEHRMLRRLWQAGAAVPYPIDCDGAEMTMEYMGTLELAAPRLVEAARSGALDYPDLWRQCRELLRIMVRSGVVHADLSPYNLLVWHRRLIAIDFPQAVDLGPNGSDLEFLHRDVANVCRFFSARGVDCDAEEVFADLVSFVPWPQ